MARYFSGKDGFPQDQQRPAAVGLETMTNHVQVPRRAEEVEYFPGEEKEDGRVW